MLLLLLLLLLFILQGYHAFLASESDFGKFEAVEGLYFVDNLALVNKVHLILSVPECDCIGAADVQKINQVDYMAFKEYLFSFGVYTNSQCKLIPEVIEPRTSLHVNFFNNSISGLYKGIVDFKKNTRVAQNKDVIFSTDKSGGILLTEGTVMMRPCMLWPWYVPWILDTYGESRLTMKWHPKVVIDATTPITYKDYFIDTAADVSAFNTVTENMLKNKIIKDKHLANLEDNTGSKDVVDLHKYEALFIPHRFTDELLTLLAPFQKTTLSPKLYVPFVFQLMWDRSEHNHWSTHSGNNATIHADPRSLLKSCKGLTVDQTMANINEPVAQEMFYEPYMFCGGVNYIGDATYVIHRTQQYIVSHVYQTLFIIFFLTSLLLVFCLFRAKFCTVLFTWCSSRLWNKKNYSVLKKHHDDDEDKNSLKDVAMQEI